MLLLVLFFAPKKRTNSFCFFSKRSAGKPAIDITSIDENLEGFDGTRGGLFCTGEIIEGRDGLDLT